MQFEPKTKQQLLDERLVAGSEYDATVVEAADEVSKKGNPMIAIKVNVYRKDGNVTQLRDWLVPAMGMKLLMFCESAGLKDKYDAGNVTADDCYQRDVRVLIGSQKDPGGQFPDKLVIRDYLARTNGSTPAKRQAPAKVEKVFEEADIPF